MGLLSTKLMPLIVMRMVGVMLFFLFMANPATAKMLAQLGHPTATAATQWPTPRFVTPQGAPAVGPWLGWLDTMRAPAPAGPITIWDSSICADGVTGCSVSPAYGYSGLGLYAADRDSFYFELGHIFDWATLTSHDRALLARKWGVPHWHWTTSDTAINEGTEDGLEGIFAQVYQDCAYGNDTRQMSYSMIAGPGVTVPVPSIFTGRFDTCAFIQRAAR